MLNKVIFAGRLTADPELKSTGNQISVVSFSVAVERNIKSKDGNREVDFIPVTAWRHTAEFISKYFRKGQMILISGELQSRKYEDKNGAKRTIWEVIASEAHFCGGAEKAESTETESGGGSFEDAFEAIPSLGGDLPF